MREFAKDVKIGGWFQHIRTGWVGQVHCWTDGGAMVRLPKTEWIVPDRAAIGLLPVRALEMLEADYEAGYWIPDEEPAEVSERNRKSNESRLQQMELQSVLGKQ